MWRDDNAPRLAASAPPVTAEEREAWRSAMAPSRPRAASQPIAGGHSGAAPLPVDVELWRRTRRVSPQRTF